MFSVYEGLFLRCFGLIVVLPFGEGLSLLKRLALATILTFLLASQVAPSNVYSIGGEIVLGMIIGLPAALAIGAIEMWGDMADNLRGQNQGSMNDPLFGTTSLLGGLLRHYGFALLLVAGLLDSLIGGLSLSVTKFPIGSVSISSISDGGGVLLTALARMLDAAIYSLIPVAVVCIAVEALAGAFGKILPKISLSSEAFQLRSVIVILIIFGLMRLELFPTILQAATSGMTILSEVAPGKAG
jgi:type III secretory pathway component EscT